MIVTVACALTGLFTWKFDSVTPSPAITGSVVAPQCVNWPVKFTVKLLGPRVLSSSTPLLGLIVSVGVLA